ncbi:MAG: 2-hydroxyhepta-2,4-diene-1,7-dioate isomerase [Porticoccaceae bacterium]|nr:2-hydroxyhepta-2,4-diene-1,7-dioate isomerase [Porticoccaceae bacterium]
MKLLRYGAVGLEKPAAIDLEGNIRCLSDVVDDIDGASIQRTSIERLKKLDLSKLPLVSNVVRIGPCVAGVGKFLCIGLNYSDHAKESGMAVPPEPVVFSKFVSAICGPNDDIVKPRGSTKLDWEVELGLVIGEQTSYVSESEAMASVAGFCVCNDISEREFQLERSGQWDLGKGCDTFGPIGPWLVTPDEIDDVMDLKMWLEVNGRRFQDGNSKTMIFSPAKIVSFLSQYMTLMPGDVISTGTPPGVGFGQNPQVYLDVGDSMTLGIQGLGLQTQRVIADY